MFPRRIFRSEAASRPGQTEPLDTLLRVTAPREWLVLLLVALVAVAAAAWAVFGTVERTVAARCVLVQSGQRYALLSATAGNVVEVLAEVGDRVEPEQLIARIKTSDIDRQLVIARSRVEVLEASAEPESDALAVAQADLEQLEALQEWGEHIVTPFGGTLTGHNLVPGQAVTVGSEVAAIRGPGDGTVEVLSLVAHEDATRLEAGMSARVLVDDDASDDDARSDHGPRALDAVVADVADHAGESPGWLAALTAGAIAGRGHLIRLHLTGAPELPVADGEACVVRVVVARDRPVRLLAAGVSAGVDGPAWG